MQGMSWFSTIVVGTAVTELPVEPADGVVDDALGGCCDGLDLNISSPPAPMMTPRNIQITAINTNGETRERGLFGTIDDGAIGSR